MRSIRPAAPVRALAFAALPALFLAACALAGGSTYPEDAPARAAADAPARFVSAEAPGADTIPGGGCRSPLVDPRDGTQVRMANAQTRVGDYAVPAGRYGVGRGELLRIECNTGRVVGVVPGRA